MTEVVISAAGKVLTMIHSYHTEPATQDRVFDGLVEALALYGRRMAGHLSSSVHKSLDGLRVTSYSQWDPEASKALFDNPEALQQSLAWFAPYTKDAVGQDAHLYGPISVYRP